MHRQPWDRFRCMVPRREEARHNRVNRILGIKMRRGLWEEESQVYKAHAAMPSTRVAHMAFLYRSRRASLLFTIRVQTDDRGKRKVIQRLTKPSVRQAGCGYEWGDELGASNYHNLSTVGPSVLWNIWMNAPKFLQRGASVLLQYLIIKNKKGAILYSLTFDR